ncbi:matrix remodeling-associated protein 8-like [Triplophysa rosa]|uniref:matrix remodeling-associated protein 8-like n=1 Tax=Triplophysa rosa TaxID=992332 RepID=UPI00254629C8|nr:matrix remodeling-associated protein 8-like [Triplophysa rosa]
MVLILCIFACGSALLFCSLIYCRPQTGLHVEGYYWVHLGASAVLPCFNNKNLPADVKTVKWNKSGLKDPLCVFEDGEVQHPASFSPRANFLSDNFTLGNFSLLLKNVTTEDKGRYTCTVHSGQRSVLSVSVNLEYYEDGSDVRVDYSWNMVVPLGASVLLPCINDKPLTAEELKVEWKKSDSESPVFVYQDERSEINQSYSGRAHFSTDDIKHGIFSLVLKYVTAQDDGQYTCEVYSGKDSVLSVNTTLELRLLDTVLCLQMFLVVCPNIIMFFAFVFWGVSEGSVYETVFSCALYFLRPLMLLFAAPYKKQFKGTIETLLNWSLNTYYISFTTVLYSVLFKSAWEKSLNYTAFDIVMTIVHFVIVLFLCLAYIIYTTYCWLIIDSG